MARFLSGTTIDRIQRLTAAGEPARDVADAVGVSVTTVQKYRHGESIAAVAATRPRSTVIVRRADEPTFALSPGAGDHFDNYPASRNDDGPRHGTERGYLAHTHEDTEPCAPCRRAARDATAVIYRARQHADNAREDTKRRTAARHAARRAGRSAPAPIRPSDFHGRAHLPTRPTNTDRN